MEDKRFNVVEVLDGPHIGRLAVVPVRRTAKNPLRLAQYRVCNVEFDFADGIACGIMMERRRNP
jgi:hypothetical protein